MEKHVKIGPVQIKQKAKRQFIQKVVAKLFAEYGYSATSIEMISNSTDMNKGSLYHYYESKSDILFDICYDFTKYSLEFTKKSAELGTAREALVSIIQQTLKTMRERLDVTTTYFQERPYFAQIFSQDQQDLIKVLDVEYRYNISSIIERGVKDGSFRKIDSTSHMRILIGILSWGHNIYKSKLNNRRTEKEIEDFILRAIEYSR